MSASPAVGRRAAFSYQERVRWRHVDAAGILHFAAIFQFFEAAEFEFFRHLGYPTDQLHPGLPRVTCDATFLAPIRLDEVLDTSVRVQHVGTTSFRLSFEVTRAGDLVATGSTSIVQADENSGKAIPLEEGKKIRMTLEEYRKRSSESGE